MADKIELPSQHKDAGSESPMDRVLEVMDEVGGIDIGLQLLNLKLALRNITLNRDSKFRRKQKYDDACYATVDLLKEEGKTKNIKYLKRDVAVILAFIMQEGGFITDTSIEFPESVVFDSGEVVHEKKGSIKLTND